MIRFTIRESLLLFATISALLGWWADRSRLNRSIHEHGVLLLLNTETCGLPELRELPPETLRELIDQTVQKISE